jgi:hypothetical protein
MSASTKASVKTGESKTGDSSSHVNKTNVPVPINSPIDQIYSLQRTVGNREVERLLKSGVIQVNQAPTTALPTAPAIQTKLREPRVEKGSACRKGVMSKRGQDLKSE